MQDDQPVDQNKMEDASKVLGDLNERLSAVLARIEQGDDVAEEELEILAMEAVNELEALRDQMAEIAGDMTPEQMREHARAHMNDDEYAQYLLDQKSLEEYRQRKRERNG